MIAAPCKSAVSSRVARAGNSRARVVRVSAQKGGLETIAAGVLAATILAAPANAGVVLQQPELKKVFQSDAPAPAPVKKEYVGLQGLTLPSAPSTGEKKAAEPKPKKQEVSEQGGDIDPRSVALPGAVLLVAGGFAAAYKIDEDFGDFMDRGMLKDSNVLGAGFEPALKTEGGPSIGKAAGTKKVSKKGKK